MSEINIVGDFYSNLELGDVSTFKNMILNLEGAATDTDFPVPQKICLKFDCDILKANLSKLNPALVTLANNHIYDFGEEGVTETIRLLDELKIPYIGVNGHEYYTFQDVKINDLPVRVYAGCCLSTHPFLGAQGPVTLESVKARIGDVDPAYFNILITHWGDEEIGFSKPSDIRDAKKLATTFSLIIGHHGHVIQNSIYLGTNVHYLGIGNYIFDDLDIDVLGQNEKFIKRQNNANKKGLCVRITQAGVTPFVMIEGTVVRKYRNILGLYYLNDLFYDVFYKIYILKIKIVNFLDNPKAISSEKIKRLFRDLLS
jgi:hypothetical protein